MNRKTALRNLNKQIRQARYARYLITKAGPILQENRRIVKLHIAAQQLRMFEIGCREYSFRLSGPKILKAISQESSRTRPSALVIKELQAYRRLLQEETNIEHAQYLHTLDLLSIANQLKVEYVNLKTPEFTQALIGQLKRQRLALQRKIK